MAIAEFVKAAFPKVHPSNLAICQRFAQYSRYIPSICAERLISKRIKGAKQRSNSNKILDHRGIVVSDPVGAMARLQLGRAYVLSEARLT